MYVCIRSCLCTLSSSRRVFLFLLLLCSLSSLVCSCVLLESLQRCLTVCCYKLSCLGLHTQIYRSRRRWKLNKVGTTILRMLYLVGAWYNLINPHLLSTTNFINHWYIIFHPPLRNLHTRTSYHQVYSSTYATLRETAGREAYEEYC